MDKAEEQLKKEIDKIKFKDGVRPELTRNSMDAFSNCGIFFLRVIIKKLKDVTKS